MIGRGRRFLCAFGCAALVAGASGAAAADVSFSDQDKADASCAMAISIAGANGKDTGQEQVQKLTTAMLYFIGKLKGRHPDLKSIDILTPDLMKTVAPKLPAELQRCSSEIIETGGDLTAAGEALTAAGY